MTRDDAVKRVIDSRYGPAAMENTQCQAEAHAVVREYVALGMLKLDEPKSEEAKRTETNWALARAFRDWERATGSHLDLLGYVEAAGLRIVEK